MIDYKGYFQNCIQNNDIKELSLSWHFLGERVATNDTMVYQKGSIYQIAEFNSKFNGHIFYCDEDYLGKVNWNTVSSLDEANQTVLSQGLTATAFTFFNTTVDSTNVATYVRGLEEGYQPFTKYEATTSKDIIIDDDQYYQIMQVIGQPWIKDRELEYNRQAILKLAVEPALRMYYTYFPLVQEEVRVHSIGDYLIKYPEYPYPAYKAIAWVTSAGPKTGPVMNMSPLSALGTDVSLYTRSSRGNKFAQGLHYNKPVPGFTGESEGSAFSEMAQNWPIANTMKNLMRREKLSKVHLPDGIYAKGYSTLSGYLNIKWLCWSRYFDDVDFEDWSKVIRLCQAHVKFSIGAIRDLLRADSNVPFKEGIQKEGADEIREMEKEWSESPNRLIFTPSRGGVI